MIYVWAGVAVLILALAFVVADAHAINAAYRFYVLSQRGRPVLGLVEGLATDKAGASGARCPRRHVKFVYIVKNEKRIENHIVHAEEVIDAKTYGSMHMGKVLSVIYDPTHPDNALINFANRLRTDSPFQVWMRANDQGRCPTGASSSH
jgi:hypothetical protein